MQPAILFLSTATIFLVLDAIMLRTIMRPLFEGHIGDWLLEDIRWRPAVVFYLFYVAGLLWFVSLPALRADAPLQALAGGMVLGALAYGTYEFTNLATLTRWSWAMVATDLAWGTVLTGAAAALGVWAVRALGL